MALKVFLLGKINPLQSLVFSRPFIATIENATKSRKEKEAEDLAADVRQADLKQIMARIDADFAALDAMSGGDAKEAVETALDMKWIRDRQMILSYFGHRGSNGFGVQDCGRVKEVRISTYKERRQVR